jgi:orotidine-5'-phosphate decarboxylase
MAKHPKDYLALALDNTSDQNALEALVKSTAPFIGTFKIGLEQFTRFGPPVLDIIKKQGGRIFLDLKYHDIPNTVAKAVEAACGLGVDFLTIHATGGSAMMKAAAEAVGTAKAKGLQVPKIIGVTLLTSISADVLRDELAVHLPPAPFAARLARLAAASGLDGIVCSPADLVEVTKNIPSSFEIITPGIRPAGTGLDDQARVATPQEAIKNGATVLVIGRPITAASDPAQAAADICAQCAGILK